MHPASGIQYPASVIPVFINGLGCISPQKTTDPGHFLDDPLSFETNRLNSIDPGYKDFIPAELIRRMGRIIKMGVAASKMSLRDAGRIQTDGTLLAPEAIITGTGLGCLEDTGKFLTSMIANNEEFLTPTSFIQSTHNTVAGQIALLLKCHGYNFTFVHRGFSFESALLDAITQIRSGEFSNLLVGGSDEITSHSYSIMDRMGHWKQKPIHSINLLDDPQRGTIAGEGASFFFLENKKNDHTRAEIKGIATILNPSSTGEIAEKCRIFLNRQGLIPENIGLVISGMNGDPRYDKVYNDFIRESFPDTPLACFKHLCGDYQTATAFALWMAAMIMDKQTVPQVIRRKGEVTYPLENILIYNHYRNMEHSFILVARA
ncbi:MAG: beta-ketoacyl synthase N-terminal-like domain-containing protein [Bacteroidota bacterium]